MKTATVLLLAMLAGSAGAQPSGGPPDAAGPGADCMHMHKGGMHKGKGRRMQRLQEELGLSAEQQTQVEAVFRDQFEKHRAEMEARQQAMHAEVRAELAKVLTPEQLAKFDALHEERSKRRAEWRERRQQAPAGTAQ